MAGLRCSALVTGFDLAGFAAAITLLRVAVIALFLADDETVTAACFFEIRECGRDNCSRAAVENAGVGSFSCIDVGDPLIFARRSQLLNLALS